MKRNANVWLAGLALATCSVMSAQAQTGRVVQSGTLVNQASRLCAEVQSRSNRDGIAVQQGDCRSGLGEWDFVDLGNGEVSVRNRVTGRVLDVSGGSSDDGARVQQYGWNGSSAQRWRIDGNRLVNVGSGKCLDVDNGSRNAGAAIQQWGCHGRDNQQWRLEGNYQTGNQIGDRGFGRPGEVAPIAATGARPQGRTLYSGMIHSRATGKCADVQGASTADGADIRQWSCNGTNAQLFDIVDVGRGEVAFVAQNSGKVMEVTGEARRSGSDVVQRGWNGGANQRWRMEPFEAGYSRIVSVASNKCLDLEAGRNDDGANIAQYDCHGAPNQQWRVEVRGTGAGWNNYRPGNNNWWNPGRTSFEEPPSYMVGDFKASNGLYGSAVELSIYSDGVVVAKIDNNQRVSGYFRDGQVFIGNNRYDATQERNGFRLTPSGQSGGGVVYTRSRYESPRGGRYN